MQMFPGFDIVCLPLPPCALAALAVLKPFLARHTSKKFIFLLPPCFFYSNNNIKDPH